MIPAVFVAVPALPLTASGKLDRTALPSPPPPSTQALPAGSLDEREAALAELWRSVLGLAADHPLDCDSDFFALGGHSLLVLKLQSRIQRRWGRALSLAELIAAPTLSAQAEGLRLDADARQPARTGPALVSLREGGARAPLVIVHPVGGAVSCYLPLARALPQGAKGRPVLGLQAAGLEIGSDVFEGNLVAMAAGYVDLLRDRYGDRPFHLAGWSMGGAVAYEMTCQLAAADRRPLSLTLLESYAPHMLVRFDALHAQSGEPAEARLVRAFAQDLLRLPDIPPLTVTGARDPFVALLLSPWLTESLPDMDSGQLRQLFKIFCANNRALLNYRPGHCPVPLTLLAAEDVPVDDPCRGWREVGSGGCDLHSVAGNHYSILTPPMVERCAAVLAAAMGKAEKFGDQPDAAAG